MSEPYLGQLMLVGYGFNNRGWANADGQLLAIAQYSALFSLYGTMYGGDGRTTFALPDLRGRVPIHVGTGPGLPTYRQGQRGGSTDVTLAANQIPGHTHPLGNNAAGALHGSAAAVNAEDAAGNFLGKHEGYRNGDASASATLQPGSVTLSGSTEPNSGGQPHNNLQPYLTLRYLVALTGIFPSRS